MPVLQAWNAAKLMAELAHVSAMQATLTATAIQLTAANQRRNVHARKIKNKPAGAVIPQTATRVSAKTAPRNAMLRASSGAHAKAAYIPQP